MKKILMMFLCFTSASSFGDPLKEREALSVIKGADNKENLSPDSHEWLLNELALRGDLSATEFLARSYYFGVTKGIEKNPAKAFRWYKELAEKEIPSGLCYMGFALKNGFRCEKSYEKAAQAFKGAIESPLAKRMPAPIALLNLSALYYGGKGVEKSIEKSFELFKQFVTVNPSIKIILEILEVVEKKGNMADFLFKIEPHKDLKSFASPDLQKLFECFTRMLDKGEETENKLLQLIADHHGFHVSYTPLTAIVDMVKDFYGVLDTQIPQSEIKN